MTPEQHKAASRVQAILTAKRPDGEYLYEQREVRDFIVACVFQLGLPVTADLQGTMVGFLGELEVQEGTPAVEVLEHVRAYFEETPLNPQLLSEFRALSNGAWFSDELQATATQAAERARSLLASGTLSAPRAPAAAPGLPSGAKPRRGLAR